MKHKNHCVACHTPNWQSSGGIYFPVPAALSRKRFNDCFPPVHVPNGRPLTIAATSRTPGQILDGLTLEQKLALLHQHAPALEELGLGPFRTGTEGAHGVAWLGTATVFPQPVGLAASWDAELIRRVGQAVGTEVRAKKAADPTVSLNVWAPVVNPLRHPLWGRNEEGFSEDPVLTGELASAFCAGLKGNDPDCWLTVPTLKHFLGYNNETDRSVSSSQLRQRVLHEYELPAYRIPVESGAVGAVMLSYNLVNGRPAHVSDLVGRHLRRWEGGSDLTVVTDAGAPTSLYTSEKYFDDAASAYAAAVRAGVDNFTDNGEDSGPAVAALTEALDRGLLTEEEVDRAVLRLLLLRARTGEFSAGRSTDAQIGSDALEDPAHRSLAREAAAKSVVLLRNEPVGEQVGEAPLLPLGTGPGRIAVIGTLGSRVLTDWYSGTPGYTVSLARGLRQRYDSVDVEEGVDVVALRSITTGTYVGSDSAASVLTAAASRVGTAERFALRDWGNGEYTLRSEATGLFLTAAADGYLYPSAERVGGWVVQETFRLHPAVGGSVALQHVGTGKWVQVEATTGSALLAAGTPDGAERFVLRTVRSGLEAAARAAAAADVVLVTVGNDPHLGGRETLDRQTLDLPQPEQELVRVVREANPRTVLVLVSSYPYALGALADIPAVVWTSHAGQELGNGLADVLSGAEVPRGRLPQTWYAADTDLPDIMDYDIIASGGTYRYSRAVPLYPFGHGLGYSRVRYRDAELAASAPEGLAIAVELANEGAFPASEVVQVYAAAPEHRTGFPRRLLVAHLRVELAVGEQRTVRIPVDPARLATWNVAAQQLRVEPGGYFLLVGSSAEDLPLAVPVQIGAGEAAALRTPGSVQRAESFDESGNLELVPESRDAGTAVTPRNVHRPATAIYRHWAAGTGRVSVGVISSGGGSISIERQGPADTWLRFGGGCRTVPAGFTGELELELPPAARGENAETGARKEPVLRLVLNGAVVVNTLMLG